MSRWTYPFLLPLWVLCLGLTAAPAGAGGISLRILLWGSHSDTTAPRRPEEPPIGRYMPDHGEGFILDRSVDPPLLRFDDSPEVWILQPQPGPRGDTIYRNDVGQPMLRATKLGGLTLFTVDNPEGAAAAFDGEATSLRPAPFMSPNVLLQHLIQSSARSSRAAQRLIAFSTVDDATPRTASLIAECAIAATEAINRVARRTNGRTDLTRISRVLLARGRRPDAQLSAGALTVIYAPNAGVGGRPSSERIARIISPGEGATVQVKEAGARGGR